MKDYNLVMFTHAMDFFKERVKFEKIVSKTFFYKPLEQFVDRRCGNAWQLTLNKVHETSKTIICNSKIMSLGAT
jgi:hypothetical protein